MQFYEIFSRLCKEKGKSETACVIESGISKSSLIRWKNGYNPTLDSLKKLAKYFNVSIDYLSGNEKESPEGDPKLKELYNVLEKLSDESLDKLLDYAQMLLLSQSQ